MLAKERSGSAPRPRPHCLKSTTAGLLGGGLGYSFGATSVGLPNAIVVEPLRP